jgi:hypothetical protein
MNKLEQKASELIAMAEAYGIETKTQQRGDYALDILYKVKGSRILSVITYTDSGRASVETYESTPRKKTKISLNALADHLEYYSEKVSA